MFFVVSGMFTRYVLLNKPPRRKVIAQLVWGRYSQFVYSLELDFVTSQNLG